MTDESGMSGDDLTAALVVVGAVIMISTLLSGLINRSAVPQVAVFLLLGVVLGQLGVIAPAIDAPILRVVSTLSLTLVLFTDAMTLDLSEVKRHVRLVVQILGPGTIAPAVLIAVAAWAVLGLEPAAAAVLGAALASTDPVLLRGLLRRPGLPAQARLALRLESGLNDVVLLPIVIGAMAMLADVRTVSWSRLTLSMLVLGPLAGIVVGFIAVALLDKVRRRMGVARNYESIYSIGVALAAFAAAESVHASGFLAAFAAGMTIVWFDVELCDCFVEYGETTAEMLLLFTFVLLGSGPIWGGLATLDARMVLFVVIALAIRPVVMYLALIGTGIDQRGRLLVSWYGPRGLSSLLLALLPVFAGLGGSAKLFEACSLVVLASISLHGGSVMLTARRGATSAAPPSPSPAPTAAHLPERISFDELAALERAGEPVVIADVRTARSLGDDTEQAAGAVRLDPDDPVGSARALGLPFDRWIVPYCA